MEFIYLVCRVDRLLDVLRSNQGGPVSFALNNPKASVQNARMNLYGLETTSFQKVS